MLYQSENNRGTGGTVWRKQHCHLPADISEVVQLSGRPVAPAETGRTDTETVTDDTPSLAGNCRTMRLCEPVLPVGLLQAESR